MYTNELFTHIWRNFCTHSLRQLLSMLCKKKRSKSWCLLTITTNNYYYTPPPFLPSSYSKKDTLGTRLLILKPFLGSLVSNCLAGKIVQYEEKYKAHWRTKFVKLTISQNILTMRVIFLPSLLPVVMVVTDALNLSFSSLYKTLRKVS